MHVGTLTLYKGQQHISYFLAVASHLNTSVAAAQVGKRAKPPQPCVVRLAQRLENPRTLQISVELQAR